MSYKAYSGLWYKTTRIRSIKSEVTNPITRFSRSRTFRFVIPETNRFTRTRTVKNTAGTFSYLHNKITSNIVEPGPYYLLATESASGILTENGYGIELTGLGAIASVSYTILNVSGNIYDTSSTDTLTFSDSVSSFIIRVVDLSETFTTSASLDAQQFVSRNITDTFTTTPIVSTGVARHITDTLPTISDSVTGIVGKVRNLTEITVVSDSIQTSQFLTRKPVDTFITSDVLSDNKNYPVDTLITSDSVSIKQILNRNLVDTLTTSDSVQSIKGSGVYANLTTSDSVSIRQLLRRNLTEAFTTTDIVSDNKNIIIENLTTSDSVQAHVGRVRSLQDSVTTSDSLFISRQYQASVSTTLPTITDAISYTIHRAVNITDNLTTSDSPNRQFFGARTLVDTLSLATFLRRTTVVYANLVDTLPTFSDSLNTTKNIKASFTESIPTTDHLSRQITYGRKITDTSYFSDQYALSLINYRTLEDTTSESDTAVIHANLIASPIDTLTTSDFVSIVIIRGYGTTDTLNTTDSVSRRQFLTRNLSENFTTIASPGQTYKVFFANLEDTLTTSIGIDTNNSVFGRNLTENLLTTDSLKVYKIAYANLIDTTVTSSSVSRINRAIRFFLDSSNFSDSTFKKAIQYRNASDDFYRYYLPAELSRYINAPRNLTETLNTEDIINRQMAAFRILSDSLITNGSLKRLYISKANLKDTLTTLDVLQRQIQLNRFIQDSTSFSDSPTHIARIIRNQIETLLGYTQINRSVTSLRSIIISQKTLDSITSNTKLNRLLSDGLFTSDTLQNINQRVRHLIETFLFEDLIERAAFYTREPVDESIFQDLINRNTVQYRETNELFGVTNFVLWRNTYQIAVELNEILLMSDSPDYNFVYSPIMDLLKLGDSVIFKTGPGVLGRGRIVAINVDSYTIDPFINHQSLYNDCRLPRESNFPIINKQDVALLPANYR